MGRMTRAKAAVVAEKLHIDEDAVLELSSEKGGISATGLTPDRNPLGELANNSGGSRADDDSETTEMKKSTRGKKAEKKGGKAKKNLLAASTTTEKNVLAASGDTEREEAEGVAVEFGEDDADASPSPEEVPEVVSMPQIEEPRSQSPLSTRFTRSQRGRTEDMESAEPSAVEQTVPVSEEDNSVSIYEDADKHPPSLNASLSPPPAATPKAVAALRKGTPGMRSTSNKENVEPVSEVTASPTPVASSLTPSRTSTYDALEEAAMQALTPPGPSRQPSSQLLPTSEAASESEVAQPADSGEQQDSAAPAVGLANAESADPITAMDALDDAVEKVSAEIPAVQPSPSKPKAKSDVRSKKPPPVVRTTKASQARISLAQGDNNGLNNNALASRPRPSTTLGRTGSVRQSMISHSQSAAANKRVPSGGVRKSSSQTDEPREKKEAVIPHSKPRPISLSFPTPPPAAKSKKAPTTSTFKLPGEEIAAKFKAAREERMKKEADAAEQKKNEKPVFKARPVPAGLSKAPPVKQTTSSKARESIMNGKSVVAPGGVKHGRANSVAVTKPALSSSLRLQPSELKVAKRPSTAFATFTLSTSRPRVSLGASTSVPAPAPGQRVPSGKGTSKGKEVFNRVAVAKQAAEVEKKEKEEAAKKARTAAAERGRQASREWAEKQKMKKLGVRPEPKTVIANAKEEAVPAEKVKVAEVPVESSEVAS